MLQGQQPLDLDRPRTEGRQQCKSRVSVGNRQSSFSPLRLVSSPQLPFLSFCPDNFEGLYIPAKGGGWGLAKWSAADVVQCHHPQTQHIKQHREAPKQAAPLTCQNGPQGETH